MGKQTYVNVFRTRAEAEADNKNLGQPGYSERYPSGTIEEVPLMDGTIGFKTEGTVYYG